MRPNGGFNVTYSPNAYTVCSPVWSLPRPARRFFHEPAAFNAMLTDSATGSPLVMHADDTINVH